jgi:hypothetical protein
MNGALTAHLQSGRRAGPGIHNDTVAFGPSALCHAYPNLAHVPWANRPGRPSAPRALWEIQDGAGCPGDDWSLVSPGGPLHEDGQRDRIKIKKRPSGTSHPQAS